MNSSTLVNALQVPVIGKDLREKLRAERKANCDGAKGVGAARTPKSYGIDRDHSKGGRSRDTLVDELVLEFDERKPDEPNKPRPVVYCVGCDHRSVGRDTARIRGHANNCDVGQFLFSLQ